MMKRMKKCKVCFLLTMLVMLFGAMTASATEDDNSLYSLGITTEGATVSPEFSYDVWSYNVTVPAGTTELTLDPVPSSESAFISDISGTTLNEDGTGYVTVTVQAGNGSEFTYEMNVTSDGTAAPVVAETETEPQTETETETETEAVTEDSQYVKVDKNSLQEAENTITSLKGEITNYKDKVSLFTKIMYGLIALSVILLFVMINLLLKKKDLKAELNDYRSYGYTNNKKAQKAQEKAEKQYQKEQIKQQPKKEKQPKKQQAVQYPDDREFHDYTNGQPMQSAVKPASMQNTREPQMSYGAPQQAAQSYAGLEVQPQKSQKKSKQMPQYEQPMQQAPVQPQAKQPMQQPPVQQPQQSGKKKKADVEVTMIDL